ncbi:Uncharacterized protein TPAR_07853 [Tolypocladium paradoxum]|uniref:SRR1-like domain-containing protein n=1 Tax=Tolypocladium paradoxum TaxID=94208 RepID=A0A2S4KP26_9HYPO|nr:Uncharacterized protein TPAR_07853 [Tolypocladium paradoxum]
MTPPSSASVPKHHDITGVEDEWTFVRPKKPRRNNPPRPSQTPSPATSRPPARTAPPRSVSDIAAEYRALRSAWESSPACRAVRALVAAHAAAAPVTQAVCLGIGTFDPADGGWEARRRTYLQLIAFLVMVDELDKKTGGSKLPCFFQEPAFTASDASFIASLGHRVVDSPAGCERVDRSTLLFGVHLYRPVYALALKNGLPAVFVGTGWDVWDHVSLADDARDLAGLEVMEQTYEKAAFPQDALGTAFSSTSVYWRPAASEQALPGSSREAAADTQDDLADNLASVSIT